MIRRNAIDDVGLLDQSFFIYGEDIDYCKRFADRGWQGVFVSDAEAINYAGASSSNAPLRFYIEIQKDNLSYCRKHGGRISELGYKAILVVHHSTLSLPLRIRCALSSPLHLTA